MSRTPAPRTAPAPTAGGQADSRWPEGHPRRRRILLVLCLSLLVVVIDNTILNTALPTLAGVLHAGTSSLQWITDAYTLCFAALLIPAGALGDRYGRRLSLLGGLTVFALGSTAAAFVGVLRCVPETAEPGTHRLDLVGTLLVAGSLFAIVDTIIEAPARGWTGTVTLAEAAAGLVALAVFAWWELRIENPLIDLRVFAVRAFTTAAASVTVIFFALSGSLFVLTQYLQLVHGYSPLSAGVRALPFAFAMAAVSPVSPILAKLLGARVIIPAGMALMGGGLLDLSTAGVHAAYPPLAIAVAIMGAGMGLVMAPASSTIMTTVPAHQAGAGSAINDTIREVGAALGVAIVGSLSAAVYGSRLGGVLTAAHVPSHIARVATSSVAAADVVGRQAGGQRGSELVAAAHTAFTDAM